MKKNPLKSKTIIGFGLLTLILIGQYMGILPNNVATEIIKALSGFLGIYGVRDAIN